MPATDRGLHARVLDALGLDIVEGRPPVGSALPLDELGERFGVSRSVLREAVRVLQSLGMVEPRQRLGTLVQPRSDWDLMAPRVILWRGRSREYLVQMRELLELRLGLEPVAARLCATSPDSLRAALVRQAAVAMVEAAAAGDGRRYLEADVAFHTGLLRGSGNAVVGHFASTVEAVLRTRTEEQRSTVTEWTADSARRHLALADALVAGDAAAAETEARALVAGTLDEFVQEGARRERSALRPDPSDT